MKKIIILIGKGKSTLTNFFVDIDEVSTANCICGFSTFSLLNKKYHVMHGWNKHSKEESGLICKIVSGESILVERKVRYADKNKDRY